MIGEDDRRLTLFAINRQRDLQHLPLPIYKAKCTVSGMRMQPSLCLAINGGNTLRTRSVVHPIMDEMPRACDRRNPLAIEP